MRYFCPSTPSPRDLLCCVFEPLFGYYYCIGLATVELFCYLNLGIPGVWCFIWLGPLALHVWPLAGLLRRGY